MATEKLSPIRHLEHLALRSFRNTDPSIRNSLAEISGFPELMEDRIYEFDQTLQRLELLIERPDCIAERDQGNYQNLTRLRELLGGQAFSSRLRKSPELQVFSEFGIGRLSFQSQFNKNPSEELARVLSEADNTFAAIADKIKNGEWDYLKDVDNPGVFISALLIEGYGLFFERYYEIKGLRTIFVRAFEEVLGTEYDQASLWKDVKPWVFEEYELFSWAFIESVGHPVNWIIRRDSLEGFREKATQLGLAVRKIGKPGDCIPVGNAEAEIAKGNTGLTVIAPSVEESLSASIVLRQVS